ncbi:MAG TPA: M56 family metallopeptidase [Terracidiphilus sp.]|jgi:beta-lactamase regulating signal transducer with metallopeptidase domain
MNPIFDSLSFLSANVAGSLFSAIWEGAVLALGVVLCLRVLPGLSAAGRSVIWLNLFVLLSLLHVVPALVEPKMLSAGAHIAPVHLDPRWSLAVVALWLAISVGRAAQLIQGAFHLRRLARRAVPVETSPELQSLLADNSNGRVAELCTSDEVARPSVLGFFRPRVLVPPALIEALSPEELQQVVLHEMEHLRRADDWTNLLQKIGLVLFPLNPVLLWVERRLCAERELACDDRVVRSVAGRKAYALCLTHLAEFSMLRRSFSLVLGAWERRPELVRRIHRILAKPARVMGRGPAVAATGGLLAGALACALVLARSPQLISFEPSQSSAQQAKTITPLDLHEIGNALGGTPQLVKANLPTPSSAAHKKLLRPAVHKHAKPHCPAPSLIAGATPVPAPLPQLDQRELVVLTQWTTYEMRPRVVLGVSHPMPAVVVPATYAVVPTPNGWIIIQI